MSWELATTLIAGIGTLAIFSFLLGENRVYRLFEHLFIGIAAGWGLVLSFKMFIWPDLLMPILGLDIVTYPDGTTSKPYDTRLLFYLFPLAFGLLFYFVYSRRFSWLARLAIGFTIGISGGAELEGFCNGVLPQVFSSFKPLLVFGPTGIEILTSITNTVFVLTLISVMYYFFFSFKRESPALQGVATSGRWLMMICFGAYFGSTVMARMALLVERLQFLLVDWKGAVWQLFL